MSEEATEDASPETPEPPKECLADCMSQAPDRILEKFTIFYKENRKTLERLLAKMGKTDEQSRQLYAIILFIIKQNPLYKKEFINCDDVAIRDLNALKDKGPFYNDIILPFLVKSLPIKKEVKAVAKQIIKPLSDDCSSPACQSTSIKKDAKDNQQKDIGSCKLPPKKETVPPVNPYGYTSVTIASNKQELCKLENNFQNFLDRLTDLEKKMCGMVESTKMETEKSVSSMRKDQMSKTMQGNKSCSSKSSGSQSSRSLRDISNLDKYIENYWKCIYSNVESLRKKINDAKSKAINIDKEAEDFLAQHAACQAKSKKCPTKSAFSSCHDVDSGLSQFFQSELTRRSVNESFANTIDDLKLNFLSLMESHEAESRNILNKITKIIYGSKSGSIKEEKPCPNAPGYVKPTEEPDEDQRQILSESLAKAIDDYKKLLNSIIKAHPDKASETVKKLEKLFVPDVITPRCDAEETLHDNLENAIGQLNELLEGLKNIPDYPDLDAPKEPSPKGSSHSRGSKGDKGEKGSTHSGANADVEAAKSPSTQSGSKIEENSIFCKKELSKCEEKALNESIEYSLGNLNGLLLDYLAFDPSEAGKLIHLLEVSSFNLTGQKAEQPEVIKCKNNFDPKNTSSKENISKKEDLSSINGTFETVEDSSSMHSAVSKKSEHEPSLSLKSCQSLGLSLLDFENLLENEQQQDPNKIKNVIPEIYDSQYKNEFLGDKEIAHSTMISKYSNKMKKSDDNLEFKDAFERLDVLEEQFNDIQKSLVTNYSDIATSKERIDSTINTNDLLLSP